MNPKLWRVDKPCPKVEDLNKLGLTYPFKPLWMELQGGLNSFKGNWDDRELR
jgi:hypothetical protein